MKYAVELATAPHRPDVPAMPDAPDAWRKEYEWTQFEFWQSAIEDYVADLPEMREYEVVALGPPRRVVCAAAHDDAVRIAAALNAAETMAEAA